MWGRWDDGMWGCWVATSTNCAVSTDTVNLDTKVWHIRAKNMPNRGYAT